MEHGRFMEQSDEIAARWIERMRELPSLSQGESASDQAQLQWIEPFVQMLADHLIGSRNGMIFVYLETLIKRGPFVRSPINEIVGSLVELGRIIGDLAAQIEPETTARRELRSLVQGALTDCALRACSYYDERISSQRERTEELIEEANLIQLYLDERGRIVRLNRRGAEILQIDPSDVLHKSLGQFILPERLDRFTELMGYLMQGLPQVVELAVTFGGVRRELSMTIHPLFDGGKVVGARGIATDITDSKALQAKLKRSEEKYRKLLENANDAIILTDLKEGAIVDVNLRACEFFGAIKEQLLGRTIMELFVQEDESKVIDLLQTTIFEGSSNIDNLQIRRRSGGVIYVETSSNVIEYGEVRVIQSILRDISERKKLEQKVTERTRELKRAYTELQRFQEDLVQSERAASLGDLAARLSSQLSEPLKEAQEDIERLVNELGVQGVGREELRGRMVLIRHSLNQARTVLHDLLDIPVKHEE
ncbi:MAG: PAS domain S-box protein, partial [Candidatus Alcyoniella australis]|nr:PAS domain S-box protein [Candidatus Alcyoniella australis]